MSKTRANDGGKAKSYDCHLHKGCWPNKAPYQNTCIPIASHDPMSFPWKWRPRGKTISYMLAISVWLPVQSSKCVLFFLAILSLLSTDYMQKLWTEILKLIVSIVFVRCLMGFFRKGFFLFYWGRNVVAANRGSLFNGILQSFAKDRCLLLVLDSGKFFRVSLKVISKTAHCANSWNCPPSAFKAFLSFA